jgi:hypothetical protein
VVGDHAGRSHQTAGKELRRLESAEPAPVKNFAVPVPVQKPRIILIDRPASLNPSS